MYLHFFNFQAFVSLLNLGYYSCIYVDFLCFFVNNIFILICREKFAKGILPTRLSVI